MKRARVREPGRRLIRLICAIFLAASSSAPVVAAWNPRILAAKAETDSLLTQGEWSGARGAASLMLALAATDSSAIPNQFDLARAMSRMADRVAALPESSLQALATAMNLKRSVDSLSATADYPASRQAENQVLGILRRVLPEPSPWLADALGDIASILEYEGRFAEAIPPAEESIRTWNACGVRVAPGMAWDLSNLAFAHKSAGEYPEAERLFRESLAMRHAIFPEDAPDISSCQHMLGLFLMEQGDLAAAAPLIRKSVVARLTLFGDKDPRYAAAVNTLGGLEESMGDWDEAGRHFQEALDIQERAGRERPELGASLVNTARARSRRGDDEGAEQLLRRAVGVLSRTLGEGHPNTAVAWGSLGLVLERRRRPTEAEEAYRNATRIFLAAGNRDADVATWMTNHGTMLLGQGRLTEADSLLREALSVNERVLGSDSGPTAIDLIYLAEARRVQGRIEEAESLLTRATFVYDRARMRFSLGLGRTRALRSPYEAQALCLLQLGRKEEAWPAVERSLARTTGELVAEARREVLTPEEDARRDTLRARLGDLERTAAALREASDSDTAAAVARDNARMALLKVQEDWSEFENGLRERYPLNEGVMFPLARIQQSIGATTALVGWIEDGGAYGPARAWGYVIRRSGPVQWFDLEPAREAGDSGSVRTAITSLREQLSRPTLSGREIDAPATRLSQARLLPMAGALAGASALVVVNCEFSRSVPIELLLRESTFPALDVTYVPSASLYAWWEEHRGRGNRDVPARALLVGDPALLSERMTDSGAPPTLSVGLPGHATSTDPGILMGRSRTVLRRVLSGNSAALDSLDPLPASKEEISSIARMFAEPVVRTGERASEQELAEMVRSGEIGSFGVVHFATHALIDDEKFDRSAIVLSRAGIPDPLVCAERGTRVYDGLLSVGEIIREWDLNAEVVSLSACRTGQGKPIAGEGAFGFTQAFLIAGARSVIVSLWDVDDRASELLMRRFYENWTGDHAGRLERRNGTMTKNGVMTKDGVMTKARALREAKEWLRTYAPPGGRQPYRSPYFWAGFVLVGAGD